MQLSDKLKQAEATLAISADRLSAFQGKLEDLIFRAQRIATTFKNQLKTQDTMFGYDLQVYRRDLRNFSLEISGLPNLMSSVERNAVYDESCVKPAQALMRQCERVYQALRVLHDHALLAHQHIREAEYKIEAWYLVQETDQMAEKGQVLPLSANKALILISSPDPH